MNYEKKNAPRCRPLLSYYREINLITNDYNNSNGIVYIKRRCFCVVITQMLFPSGHSEHINDITGHIQQESQQKKKEKSHSRIILRITINLNKKITSVVVVVVSIITTIIMVYVTVFHVYNSILLYA